jgi:hypothetical protein
MVLTRAITEIFSGERLVLGSSNTNEHRGKMSEFIAFVMCFLHLCPIILSLVMKFPF